MTEARFNALVARDRLRLTGLANSIVKNPDSADQVAQTALLEIWQKYGGARILDLEGLVSNRVKWRAFDFLRKKGRQVAVFESAYVDEIEKSSINQATQDPLVVLLERYSVVSLCAFVAKTLNKPIELEVWERRALAGEEYSEIAENLGITEVNARKIYSRANKILREKILQDEGLTSGEIVASHQ